MSGLFSLESWSTVWTHRESFLLGLGNDDISKFLVLDFFLAEFLELLEYC